MTVKTYIGVHFLHLEQENCLQRNKDGSVNRVDFPSCSEVYHFHYHFLTFITRVGKQGHRTNWLQTFFAGCTQITESLPCPPSPQTRPVTRLFKTATIRWSTYKRSKIPHQCVVTLSGKVSSASRTYNSLRSQVSHKFTNPNSRTAVQWEQTTYWAISSNFPLLRL